VTWSQLGIHSRPIILLNVNGFYTSLLEWISTAVRYGFIRPANANIIVEAKSVEEIVEKVERYELPDGRYRLDWSVQSPLGSPSFPSRTYTNGDSAQM